MKHDIILYLLVMTAVTFAIRLLPLTLLRRPIKGRFLSSFLYYVPYVTLAVMTFPAIVEATQVPAAGAAALVAGIALVVRGEPFSGFGCLLSCRVCYGICSLGMNGSRTLYVQKSRPCIFEMHGRLFLCIIFLHCQRIFAGRR